MGLVKDASGYYTTLNLTPGADIAEVRLAYAILKVQKGAGRSRSVVQEAYECLGDPVTKAEYDCRGLAKPNLSLRPWILSFIFLGLVGVGGFLFPGFLVPAPKPFSQGDQLIRRSDQTPLGQIVRREELHVFPGGQTATAYLVRMDDGTERWMPASDLEHHYQGY